MQPRLLKEWAAAEYLGVSKTTLRKLDLPRRMLRSLRLYDIHDLDAYADALPYEGEGGEHGRVNTCDEVVAEALARGASA